jgi:hypothetical protein
VSFTAGLLPDPELGCRYNKSFPFFQNGKDFFYQKEFSSELELFLIK